MYLTTLPLRVLELSLHRGQTILDKHTMVPWVFSPLVTFWQYTVFLLSPGSATDTQRKAAQTVVHRSVGEAPDLGIHLQHTMSRIGTKVHHSEAVPREVGLLNT